MDGWQMHDTRTEWGPIPRLSNGKEENIGVSIVGPVSYGRFPNQQCYVMINNVTNRLSGFP